MIHLMLQGPRQEARSFNPHRISLERFGFELDGNRALDLGRDIGKTEATFAADIRRFSKSNDWIEQDQRHRRLEIGDRLAV